MALLKQRGVGLSLAATTAFASGSALAAFRTAGDEASIAFQTSAITPAMVSGDTSVMAWFRWEGPQVGHAALFTLPGRLRISVDGSGSLIAEVSDGGSGSLVASAGGALVSGEWALLSASFDASSGELAVWSIGEDGATHEATNASPGFVPAGATAGPVIGAHAGLPAAAGTLATIVVRGEAVLQADLLAAWAERSVMSPFFVNASGAGGGATGEGSVQWMSAHAMTTLPRSALTYPSNGSQRAAVVGEPVTIYNVHAYQWSGPLADNTRVVRPVLHAGSFVHVSAHEEGSTSFFVRRTPDLNQPLPQPPEVAAVAPRLRRAFGPSISGLSRVVTTGNSRSQKRADGSGQSPGNYAHGFIGLDPSRVAGVLNRPPLDTRAPWFGLDATDNAPWFSGQRVNAEGTDFARFWTGSGSPDGPGAGQGMLLRAGSQFGMRCRPEGLMLSTSPLVVRVHTLRFPGSSSLRVWKNQHDRQGQLGTDVGAFEETPLDTTRLSIVLDGVSSMAVSPTELRLVLGGEVLAGDAVSVGDSISVVGAVLPDSPSPGVTTLLLEHPLSAAPGVGAVVRIGEWGFAAIDAIWEPLPPGDPLSWRGVRLEAGDGPVGAVALGVSAWRPDADGVIWGVAGWGGNGYDVQLSNAFSGATVGWMRELGADVWLQTFAQQDTGSASMSEIASLLNEATPWADIVWLGDASHGGAHSEVWHRFILENAASHGFAAVTLVEHPEVGDLDEQIADGMRSDQSHFSQRGNEILARLWTEAFGRIGLPVEPAGDTDRDGDVDFADLNAVLTGFGSAGAGVPGDANFDNVVDFSDLNTVLTNYGTSVVR